MGQAERTTKLRLDLGEREQGGANHEKRTYLEETAALLNAARTFYLDFFLAHAAKLCERVQVVSKKTGEVREAVISANKLLSLSQNISPLKPTRILILIPGGTSVPVFLVCPANIAERRIKDCIGKAIAYVTTHETWKQSSKKKGKPGPPTPRNPPTLYEGTFSL